MTTATNNMQKPSFRKEMNLRTNISSIVFHVKLCFKPQSVTVIRALYIQPSDLALYLRVDMSLGALIMTYSRPLLWAAHDAFPLHRSCTRILEIPSTPRSGISGPHRSESSSVTASYWRRLSSWGPGFDSCKGFNFLRIPYASWL